MMPVITTTSPAISAYLQRAMLELGDLPPSDRQSLLEEIEHILTEVTSEIDGDPEDLLGPPERFVADLRSAAGYHPVTGPDRTGRPTSLGLLRQLVVVARPQVRSWMRQLWNDLRPGWWLMRGYLATFAFTAFGSPPKISWLGFVPVPTLSAWFGALLAGFGMVASVLLGQRSQRTQSLRLRIVGAAISVLALAVALSLGTHAKNRTLFGSLAYADTGIGYEEPSYVDERFMSGTTVVDTDVVPTTTMVADAIEMQTPDGQAMFVQPFEVDDLWAELATAYDPNRIVVIDRSGHERIFGTMEELQGWLNASFGVVP